MLRNYAVKLFSKKKMWHLLGSRKIFLGNQKLAIEFKPLSHLTDRHPAKLWWVSCILVIFMLAQQSVGLTQLQLPSSSGIYSYCIGRKGPRTPSCSPISFFPINPKTRLLVVLISGFYSLRCAFYYSSQAEYLDPRRRFYITSIYPLSAISYKLKYHFFKSL